MLDAGRLLRDRHRDALGNCIAVLSVSVAVRRYWPAALNVTVVLAPLVENVGAAAPLGTAVAVHVTFDVSDMAAWNWS